MPKMQTPLIVWLEGRDEPVRATSDQRDLARMEAADLPEGAHTRARFVAWSVLARSGQYPGTWQQFNDRDCIEVESLIPVDDGAGDEQGLDPGQTSTSATG